MTASPAPTDIYRQLFIDSIGVGVGQPNVERKFTASNIQTPSTRKPGFLNLVLSELKLVLRRCFRTQKATQNKGRNGVGTPTGLIFCKPFESYEPLGDLIF
jgi:hypothetical protein